MRNTAFHRVMWASIEAVEEMARRPGSGIPKTYEAEIPLLRCSKKWRVCGRAIWFLNDVAKYFPDLRDTDCESSYPSKESKFHQRIRQVNRVLVAKGEMERPTRGWWAVTERGRQRVAAWDGFKRRLERELSPAEFERFSLALLTEFGFRQVAVTWQTGDGGIDGNGMLVKGKHTTQAAFRCRRRSVKGFDIGEFRAALQGEFEHGVVLLVDDFTAIDRGEALLGGGVAMTLLDGNGILVLMERRARRLRQTSSHSYENFWAGVLESAIAGRPS